MFVAVLFAANAALAAAPSDTSGTLGFELVLWVLVVSVLLLRRLFNHKAYLGGAGEI